LPFSRRAFACCLKTIRRPSEVPSGKIEQFALRHPQAGFVSLLDHAWSQALLEPE
jgi:hypothetical protein